MFNIKLFGHFSIDDGEKKLTFVDLNSAMGVKFLAYLLIHRDKSLATNELTEILWPDGKVDNPANALKNVVYRLRRTLANKWPDIQFIESSKRGYKWNEDLEVSLDIPQFESLYNEFSDERTVDEKLKIAQSINEIYTNHFLEGIDKTYWFRSQEQYYHRIFISIAKECSELLFEINRFEELAIYLNQTIKIEQFSEELRALLIKTYIELGDYTKALEYYKATKKMLMDNFSRVPSPEIEELCIEINGKISEREKDIHSIKDELARDEDKRGVFFCTYGILENIYELSMRIAKRKGTELFLILVNIHPEKEVQPHDEEEEIRCGMTEMKNALSVSLRSSDIVSQYSTNQYLVILPMNKGNDAKQVVDRIIYNYYGTKNHARVRVKTEVLDASSDEEQ